MTILRAGELCDDDDDDDNNHNHSNNKIFFSNNSKLEDSSPCCCCFYLFLIFLIYLIKADDVCFCMYARALFTLRPHHCFLLSQSSDPRFRILALATFSSPFGPRLLLLLLLFLLLFLFIQFFVMIRTLLRVRLSPPLFQYTQISFRFNNQSLLNLPEMWVGRQG